LLHCNNYRLDSAICPYWQKINPHISPVSVDLAQDFELLTPSLGFALRANLRLFQIRFRRICPTERKIRLERIIA